MNDLEARVLEIDKTLRGLSLSDTVEVLSNILILQGISRMNIPMEISEITTDNVIDIVIKDKKQNGETLHNALAHQGLLMLMWLRKR